VYKRGARPPGLLTRLHPSPITVQAPQAFLNSLTLRFFTLAATLVFAGVVAATPVATAAAVRHTETLTDGTVVIIVHNGYVPMC
jgi:hypothetical protein